MTKLRYLKDDFDTYTTVEYEVHVNSKWLLEYILNNTEYENIADFLTWCISEDVDEIMDELDNDGMAYSYNKTGRYCDIDDLM